MKDRARWPVAVIFLHWLMAILIVALYVLGDYMVGLDYYDPWYQSAPFWHKSVGLLIALLLIMRLGVRMTTQAPSDDEAKKWVAVVSHAVHVLLYGLVLVICVSGFLISTADGRPVSFFGWFDVPSLGSFFDDQEDVAGVWHERAALGVLVLAALHAVAALKHHFIDRDRVLKRMLGLRG